MDYSSRTTSTDSYFLQKDIPANQTRPKACSRVNELNIASLIERGEQKLQLNPENYIGNRPPQSS